MKLRKLSTIPMGNQGFKSEIDFILPQQFMLKYETDMIQKKNMILV